MDSIYYDEQVDVGRGKENAPHRVKDGNEGVESPRSTGAYNDWSIQAVNQILEDNGSDIAEDIVLTKSEEGLIVLGDPPPSATLLSVSEVLRAYRAERLPSVKDAMPYLTQLLQKTHNSSSPVYLVDMGRLYRFYEDWCKAFPRVKPFYAVKCNPNPAMVALLAALGAGFDCASEGEIDLVLSFGVPAERIIYAHPCKPPAQLDSAARKGINLTTFDTPTELYKIARWHPETSALIRIRADDPTARCCLGNKYGCEPSEVAPLLLLAANLGVQVSGVSFHVGSGAMNPEAFSAAIMTSRQVFGMGADLGFAMSVLDIGGGFGGAVGPDGHADLKGVSEAINTALDLCFPPEMNITIIAEPGRYFAEAPSTLACSVYGRRDRCSSSGQHKVDYWISDGIYGSLNGIIYDHTVPQPLPLHMNTADKERKVFPTTLFGPTCDGADVILKNYMLPELDMGDWVVFPNMGAYSIAGACNFNGFQVSNPPTFYIYSDQP
eukprot:jgi/Botrbrau1/20255/Bobra.31_1s0041.2